MRINLKIKIVSLSENVSGIVFFYVSQKMVPSNNKKRTEKF